MNDMMDRLRALPPELPQPPDRFEQIRSRVATRRRRRLLVGTATLIACAILGTVVTTSLMRGQETATPGVANDVHRPAQPHPVPSCHNGSVLRRVGLRQSTIVLNARGQRLGLTEPSAVAYIRNSDFCPSLPANPKQAAQMTKHRVNARGEVWIPLFTEDGTTRVGKILVGTVKER